MPHLSVSGPSRGLSPDVLKRLWNWWWAEIKGMLPERLRSSIVPSSHRAGLLVEGDQIVLIHIPPQGAIEAMGRFAAGERGLADLRLRISDLRRIDPKLTVGLIILKEQCLERTARVPRAAREDIGAILRLEIESATPFSSDAIYWDYTVLPNREDSELLQVQYLIARNSIVEAAKQRLEQADLKILFAAVLDDAASTLLGYDLLRRSVPRFATAGKSWRRYTILFAASAMIASIFSVLDQQDAALRQLDQEILARRKIASEMQALSKKEMIRADSIAELVALRNTGPRLVDVWLNLTRAIPDSAWLSDLQFDGTEVELTGFAASAASLVDVLSRAPEWTEITFKAPVTMDERAGREHFVLGLRLRAPSPLARSRGAP